MQAFMPAAYDWLWVIGMVAFAAVLLLALEQINRSTALSPTAQLVWTLVVVCLPAVGLIAWFVLKPTKPRASGTND